MPKPSKQSSDEEQWSSDDSEDNDYSESDDDRSDDESEGNGEEYSDDGSADESNEIYSEDDNDDDSYDYEKGENSEEFDDEEPSGNPRYVVTERFPDEEDGETKNSDHWWEGREKLIAGLLLCWCCLCLIIIGVVIGVVLGGRNRNKGPKSNDDDILDIPTLRPTFAPQPLPPSAMTQTPSESMQPSFTVTVSPTRLPTSRPTTSPTLSFAPTKTIPEFLGIIPDQDTFVEFNVSKEFVGEEYGLQDSFLVQNGPIKDETLSDAYGLISFPLKDVPNSGRLDGIEKSAVLQLTHVLSTAERGPSNYTVIRIPETKTRMEYWHGFYFLPPEDDDEGVKVGPTFEVSPTDTVINVDISSLFFDYEPVDGKKPVRLFLMIENRGPEQIEGGDRFYTRETTTPPQLLLGFSGDGVSNVIPDDPKVGKNAVEDSASMDVGFSGDDETTGEDAGGK